MLHRCGPIDTSHLYWNEHIKLSPEWLENFLKEKCKDNTFISLDELYELSQQKRPKLNRPFIGMTFDDGYHDNYEYALPIFDKLHIPFTVFVTNSFPDGTAFLWWYALEEILQNNDKIKLANGKEYDCGTKEQKEDIFLEIRALILKLEQKNLLEEFSKLLPGYQFDNASIVAESCLAWQEVQEMAQSQYCTIGSHTINHLALNQLTDEEMKNEIIGGKKALEAKVGQSVNHFSYPFGTPNEVGEREINAAKAAGFKTACLAVDGQVTNKDIKDSFSYPRIFLRELQR
jgi:peptidoglycan/xylan/chitin deacetylase (PgdA/CDA1 family)